MKYDSFYELWYHDTSIGLICHSIYSYTHLKGAVIHILSWNLNGLKACLKREDFKQLKTLPLLDVICFQETMTKDRPMVIPGYHHHWYPSKNKKGYSGTLTLTLVDPYEIRYGIGVEDLDQEGRVLTVDMGVAYVEGTATK